MKQLLLVFFGGGLGSAARFLFTKFLHPNSVTFPTSTFCVNVIGCFLIGIFMGWSLKGQNLSDNQSFLLITGFCGGFTTFSAFAAENHFFLKNGDYIQFIIYTLGSLILGLLAVVFGLFISKQI